MSSVCVGCSNSTTRIQRAARRKSARFAIRPGPRYAQGEADLGWLNLTATLNRTQPQDWSAFARRLLATLRDACCERSIEIAHAKLILTAGEQFLLRDLFALSAAPSVHGTLPTSVRQAALTLNLRAATAPEALQPLTITILEQARRPGLTLAVGHQACFRPGRPNPTHHLS